MRFEKAKKIAKEHGVKGFKKMNVKNGGYIVGKQTKRINKHVGNRLLNRLIEEGYQIVDESGIREMNENGVMDAFLIN